MEIDNLILIKGGAYADVRNALRRWIKLVGDQLEAGMVFKLYKNGRGRHVILADDRINNSQFYHLTNFLQFPQDSDLRTQIEAYTRGKDENIFKNQLVLIYFSKDDRDYDNVFVVTADNKNFKVGFDRTIKHIVDSVTFKHCPDVLLESPELITVHKEIPIRAITLEDETSVGKRFKKIRKIFIQVLLIVTASALFNDALFTTSSFLLGMSIAIWFFTDYQMLRYKKYFNYSCLISFLFAVYYYLTQKIISPINSDLIDFGALYPGSLLLAQKPGRLIFISLFNREPVVERPAPTFWDGVYCMILMVTWALLPLLLITLYNFIKT